MGNEFYPPKRKGIIFQGFLVLVVTAAGGYFFLRASQDPTGLGFLLNMMIALVIFAPLPLLVYRLYALVNALYVLSRDGLLIRWGLRREDIPLGAIEWIRPARELGFRLPMPWLRWPGAILGNRQIAELGPVEFLSSETAAMLLVATHDKIYAISPKETQPFLSTFRQINELGSLSPLQAQSIYPKVLLGRVYEDRLARALILIGFGLGLILLGVVGIAVARLESIIWTAGSEAVPAERLLLLSVLDGMIWLFNLLLGIFLYRRGDDLKIAGYMLWGTSILSAILLLAGSLLLIF